MIKRIKQTGKFRWIWTLIFFCGLSGCSTLVPKQTHDICQLFDEKSSWHRAAKKSEKKWGIKAPILIAIIRQESSFRSRAKPPRKKILGFIPGARPSTAYGYAQATDPTWEEYKKRTGKFFVSRSNMKDALDFVGWYNYRSHKELGLSKSDAYSLYLAYHEGRGGYRRGTYKKKAFLLRAARKVSDNSKRYTGQYPSC